jgi:tetratricopeptide (TPR) repeat protein
MMAKTPRSLQLSENGKQKVTDAMTGKIWLDADLAQEISVSEQTAEKFRLGRKVDRKYFVGFCKALELNWEEVVARAGEAEGDVRRAKSEPNRAENLQQNLNEAIAISQGSEAPNIKADANYRPQQWDLVHPYPMPPHFTGRNAERRMLSDWLNGGDTHPLLVVRALGGFGKSALTWHWLLKDVVERDWPNVVWWSFYEAQAGFDNFLRTTLKYLSSEELKGRVSQEHVDRLLQYLQQPGILLVLDGFERELRAYCSMAAAYQGDGEFPLCAEEKVGGEDNDCINLLAEVFLRKLCSLPNLKGKVLMSTRLRPRPVEVRGGELLIGCREEKLTQMHPADAVTFFRVQGIRGNRNEIEQACGNYGFHPLSLRLLAGLVVNDYRDPGDIQVAQNLDVSGDLIQRQHHVLEQAYESLMEERRRLLSRIACFRSPVTYDTLVAVDEGSQDLQADLRDLINRGLVQREGIRFDLHPIVRRYAYDRMGAAERSGTHGQLRDYFAAVPEVEQVTTIDDLAPVIELYHHMVRAGQYDKAFELFADRLNNSLYYQLGAYQQRIELLRALFPQGEAQLPQLQKEDDQAWTLNGLANSYSLSGQPEQAVPLFEASNAIQEKWEQKGNWAIGLGNLACMAQLPIGALQAAEANLRRKIALCQEIEDEFNIFNIVAEFNEAVGQYGLGQLLAYRGDWGAAEEALDRSLELLKKINNIQSQGIVWAYQALRSLLWMRATETTRQLSDLAATALSAANRALELADEDAHTVSPVERDYVRAHWLLGAAHRLTPDLHLSDHHLNEALHRCRAINMVDHEADILLDLARLRRDQGDPTEAHRLAEAARQIATRSRYVLQGADIHLFLAELAMAAGELDQARGFAQEALRLATCDGGDYTYKVAYDEAQALLKKITVLEDVVLEDVVLEDVVGDVVVEDMVGDVVVEDVVLKDEVKVFISYSWDSEDHQRKVLGLAQALRGDGINCVIDKFVQSPDNWDRWMLDQIDESDFVLIICSERYYRRYRRKEELGKGLGVTWESTLIMERIYDNQGKNVKFYPVFFTPPDRSIIPDGIRTSFYDLSRYDLFNLEADPNRLINGGGYKDLYGLLTDQPSVVPNKIGSLKKLEPIDRKSISPIAPLSQDIDYLRHEIRERPSYPFNEESWKYNEEQNGYELTIEHDLIYEPQVKVKDSAGNERSTVLVNTSDHNKVVISANRPFSGTVHLS